MHDISQPYGTFHDLLQSLHLSYISIHIVTSPTIDDSTQRAWLVALRTLPHRAWEAHCAVLSNPFQPPTLSGALWFGHRDHKEPALPPLPPPLAIFSAGLVASGGFMGSSKPWEIKVKESSGHRNTWDTPGTHQLPIQ